MELLTMDTYTFLKYHFNCWKYFFRYLAKSCGRDRRLKKICPQLLDGGIKMVYLTGLVGSLVVLSEHTSTYLDVQVNYKQYIVETLTSSNVMKVKNVLSPFSL